MRNFIFPLHRPALCLLCSILPIACVTDPDAPHPGDPLSYLPLTCEWRELALAPRWVFLACAAQNRSPEATAVAFKPVIPPQHPYLAQPDEPALQSLRTNAALQLKEELAVATRQTVPPEGHVKFYFPLLIKSQRRPAYVELLFTEPASGSKIVPISSPRGEQRRQTWPVAP